MSRRDDLVQHIRESYTLVRAYEDKIRLSDDPKEIARGRRAIEEQRALIREWSEELERLGGMPADLDTARPPEATGVSGGGRTYTVHIEHAQGLAIGDGARVEMAGPAPGTERAAVPVSGGGDIYARYEAGVETLLRRLGKGHARYGEALIYQQRLQENLFQARVYGDTEARRAERAEVLARLNALALEVSGASFNELMEGGAGR